MQVPRGKPKHEALSEGICGRPDAWGGTPAGSVGNGWRPASRRWNIPDEVVRVEAGFGKKTL